jgi:hypothetical protein
MHILRRKRPAMKANSDAVLSRCVEVTVDRETVTMLVRGQHGVAAYGSQADVAFADGAPKLPPPLALADISAANASSAASAVASPTASTGLEANAAAKPVAE